MLPDEGGRIPIRQELSVLPDVEGTLTLEDVEKLSQTGNFVPVASGEVPNFDFKGAAAYWIRFRLAPHPNLEWHLGVELPLIDRLDFYRPTPAGNYQVVSAGYTLPFSERENPNRLYFFDLGQSGTYYLRVRSRARALVPLFAIDETHFQEFALWDNFTQGFFYGLLALMIFFAFFLFVTSGYRSVYLFYAAFLCLNGLIQGYISGLAHMYLFPESPGVYETVNLAMLSSLTSMLHLLFGFSFLQWQPFGNRYGRIGFFALLGMELVIFLLGAAGFIQLAYELMSVGSFLTNIFLLTVAVRTLKQAFTTHVLLFTIGLGVFISGYIFVFAVYLELMDYFSFVTHISRLSSTGEIIFFTLALAKQLNQYRQDKQEAQEKLLRLSQEQQQQLEQKVGERTEELRQKNEEMLTQNEELRQQQEEMLAQRDLIQEQKEDLEYKNTQITDSIRYARSIQEALLPNTKRLSHAVPDHFVIYRPRDMVSGDFYWLFDKNPDYNFLALVDCTGHGVPGAFMSVMANEALNYVLLLEQLTDPAEILEHLDQVITKNLLDKEGRQDDGMVLSLLRLPKVVKPGSEIVIASAWQDAYLVQNRSFEIIKPTRRGIGSGGGHRQRRVNFENVTIQCQPGTKIYLSSDGMKDQQNRSGQKIGKKRFLQLLEQAGHMPFAEQQGYIEYFLDQHQGNEEQRDDITLLGLAF